MSGCTTYGSTPVTNSPADIVKAIQTIYNNRYNTGYNNGRVQGQNDVRNNPNGYGFYTKTQYDQNYTNGYNTGYNNGKNENTQKGPFRVNYRCEGGNLSYTHGGDCSFAGVTKIAVISCSARNDTKKNITFSSNFGFNWSSGGSVNVGWSGYNVYNFNGTASISIRGNHGNDSAMSLDIWY